MQASMVAASGGEEEFRRKNEALLNGDMSDLMEANNKATFNPAKPSINKKDKDQVFENSSGKGNRQQRRLEKKLPPPPS